MHPAFPDLLRHATSAGLAVEVFTNLTHVKNSWWELLACDDVSIATSYYSDQAAGHERITNRRGSHARTLAGIREAVRRGAEFGTVVVEDLHVAGMMKNRRLARHVADASFAEIRRQLTYKTAWHGGRLIVADRWFASSKTCSGCGAVKAKLALSERTYDRAACGLVLNRDTPR